MPDITKLTWPLNIALAGLVFAIFALIHNTHYIAYGFATFVYGVTGHLIGQIGDYWVKEKKWNNLFLFSTLGLITVLWIASLWIYYSFL